MYRLPALCSLFLTAFLLVAADGSWPVAGDGSWKDKPLAQWTEDDAKQLLADSPWVKQVTPQHVRDLSPDERRNGGDMQAGIGKGVGIAGTGVLGPRREAEAFQRAHHKPTPEAVVVRWESAQPVRAAEQKAHETGVPMVDSDHYAIVVYGIPAPER